MTNEIDFTEATEESMLRHMNAHGEAFTVRLYRDIKTSSGPLTVMRALRITPAEVLHILERRKGTK